MSSPWTERHRPQRLDEVVGNPQALASMRQWAEAWRSGRPTHRAALLAGPPGCGKTSAAHALAAEFGWEIIELNASDARSAPAVKRVAGVGAVHQTFAASGEYQSSHRGQHKLIILDEADNLYERPGEASDESGRDLSDRGGRRAIVDIVLASRQPIVLIVNDAYALLRGTGERLGRAALRVAFRRCAVPAVKRRLRQVADAEGLAVSDPTLDALAARAQGDLRSAINDLEALALGRDQLGALPEAALSERNRTTSAFEVVGTILKTTDLRRAVDAARSLDEPPDFLLAWLDENVPTEYRDPNDLARAFDRLSRADVMLGRTRRRQHFGLWAYATELLSGGVAVAKTQRYGTPPHYRFPGWIRSMGASKGSRGLRDRVGAKLGAHLHLSVDAASQQALPFVRKMAVNDAELAIHVGVALALDEDELRFLLGADAPHAAVDAIVARVDRRRTKGEEDQEELDATPPAPTPSRRASGGRSASLGEF